MSFWEDAVPKNSTPEKKIVNMWQIKRVGIRATKFEIGRRHFLRGVFVAVAVTVA